MVGDRSLAAFKSFVFPDLSGAVVVHDRYQNYDKFPGLAHQLCLAHLLRDVEDAQCYPGAIWPGQIADALRGLIRQANLARARGLAAVPDQATAPLIRAFRHGVRVGLADVRRVPAANTRQPPARLLLECLRDRELDVLRFLSDLRIPPTSNQAERDVRPAKVQQKIRPAPLRAGHPPPLRHPRLPVHRRQARKEHAHRAPRCARREPMDATRPRPHLKTARNPLQDAIRQTRDGLNAYVLS
jgi:hypothetical protein